MDTQKIKDQLREFQAEFSKITRARHPLEIRHFIVGGHKARWRQWYQLCIETDNKWQALQEAEGKQQLLALEIEELEIKLKEHERRVRDLEALRKIDRPYMIKVEKLQIELRMKQNVYERSKGYMLGALKEIEDFSRIAREEYREFWGKSEEEWANEGEMQYIASRMASQVAVDLLTFGRIQAGNLQALLQLPKETQKDILAQALIERDEYNTLAIPVQEEHDRLIEKKGLKMLSGEKK